MIKGISIFTR